MSANYSMIYRIS